jgi:tyrosyl-tRNA synthetase
MKLSEELEKRGFIGQFSAENVASILDDKKHVVYHGIDPSADSAHAGNLVVWMLLRHLMAHGHSVLFLVGGGTGMIGDPKPDSERVLAEQGEVADRVKKIKIQAENILGGQPITFVNNYDWLAKIDLLTFLRDIGKHFTINELIKKDAIARRLQSETGLSYTEFAYPLLQAYDYLTLYRERGCTLQVGGSDQWGNMVAGIDLIRRVEKGEAHVVTVPLIIDKATGKKFGKSEGNAVWLDPKKTSPYDFYQFWFNVSDESVIDYLKLFTLYSLTEIAELVAWHERNPEHRTAQKKLARAVTEIVHGEDMAEQVEKVAAALFGEIAISALSQSERAVLEQNAPRYVATEGDLLVDILVGSGLASSKREARTFLESGAVYVNGDKVVAVDHRVEKARDGSLVHVRRGKRSVMIVEIS